MHTDLKKTLDRAQEKIEPLGATILLSGIAPTIRKVDVEISNITPLDRYKDPKQKKAIDVFLNIYGIGEKKAEDLVSKNILSLDDLEKVKETHLNDKQLIGLKYYNDILQRIPRNEIEIYEKIDFDVLQRQHKPKILIRVGPHQ